MLAFVMKVGQDHYVSTILVQLRAKLALDTGHVLLQVILMPSVYVKMASPVITVSKAVSKAVMVFALEDSLTIAPPILMVLCDMAATKVEDAAISVRARIIHLVVSALTSRRKRKSVLVQMIMTVR